MGMTRISILILGIGFVFLLTITTTQAIGLEPQTASQIVDIYAERSSSPCINQGVKFDTLKKPDGTQEHFSVPEGQVLIITQVETVSAIIPPFRVSTALWRGSDTLVDWVASRETPPALSIHINHLYEFPSGLVIPSEGTLCLTTTPRISIIGIARGFLYPETGINQ
jgi:hypothetical protein